MVMKNFLLAFFAICFTFGSYAQNKKKDQEVDIIDHQVQLGESVRLISKKYLVDPAEIYKLNKFAVEGISQGMVLQIPVPRKESSQVKEVGNTASEEIVTNQKSESTPKEASIDNKPTKNESIDENPPLNNDIKKIVIKERKTEVNHKVTPKETLYSLARDFNVSVDDIKANNPEVAKNGLKIGQTIKIPKEKSIDIQQSTSVTETTTAKTEKLKSDTTQDHANQTISESNVQHHKVQPKETLYSLSKKYHVTVDDIKNQNEELLKNGLQIGQTLIIKINN
jgi:LysM repeat protein